MRKWLLVLILLTSLGAWAQTPAAAAADCAIDGKGWDQLLQDFSDGWKSNVDFCEFKRFIALNDLISSDMRGNEAQYNQRIAHLRSFNDQSEPANYLLMAFQETWFNLFIDASLDREFNKAKTWRGATTVGMLGLVTVSLVLPHMKQYSSKSVRFLRALVGNLFERRPMVLGSVSLTNGGAKLKLGQGPSGTTGSVAPPLMPDGGVEPIDERTRGVFIAQFQEEMLAAGAGVASGWIAGHYVGLGMDIVWPSWSAIFSRANWSRSKFLHFANPGMLASLAISFIVSDQAAKATANYEFRKRVEKAKQTLLDLANSIIVDVNAGNEYNIWLHSEQLKNALMLQNYLLTRNFTQSLGGESERATQTILNSFADCTYTHDEILNAQKNLFKNRVAGIIESEKLNLQAALDITQATQMVLLTQSDSLTDPLINTAHDLMLRDRMVLEADITTDSLWEDISATVKDAKVECAPPQNYNEPLP